MSGRLGWIRRNCRAGEKILDIGSASGFTFKGTELEPYVTFVDLDLYDMPNFFQMDAHDLKFPDQSFDVAVLGDILEHVEDPVQVLKEARRVAIRLVITVPDEANWAEVHNPYSSVEDLIRNENVSSVEELAEKAGPDVVKFHDDEYQHCFHNRFYTEESLRNDLKEAGIHTYDFDRLKYSGWSFFTVEVPESVKMDKFFDKTTEELDAEYDRDYFCWDGKGDPKGYKGMYADFPNRLQFQDYIKSLKPKSVLDVGCAYGFMVKSLNDAGIPAKGVDVSTFAYKMRATDDMQVASILDLPFEDGEFDLVVTLEMLEHIREEDTNQALSELARVSRRGAHWIGYKEVDDIFQTKDKTHINIKPYVWWQEKFMEICGHTHKVIYKETDWYPHPPDIPKGGSKSGLNVGSYINMLSNTEDTKWLNVDILDLYGYAQAYLYNFQKLDARKLPFPDNNFDYIVASHFLEHLTADEGLIFLQECHRVLKSEGVIRLAVPDAELLIRKYVAEELGYFDEINPECENAVTKLGKLNALLWGGHETVYDAPTLSYALQKAGFRPSLQVFNKSSRPDLMNQIFDYHPDLSLYMEGAPIKEEKPMTVGPRKEELKIAILSTPFLKSPPDHYGGLEVVTTNLAAGLADLGQDVTLFAARGSKPIGNYEVFETIDPVFDFGTDWGKIDWYEKEKAHYESFKYRLKEYDIVHGHGWLAFEYLAKRDGLASHVCHTHHGGLGFNTKPVEKMNLIAISKFMAETYSRQLGTHVQWVYNGIDLQAYPYKAVKGERLIYVGRFTDFKGTHVAIQVAKKLGMGLDLVGGAYEEPYFSEQVKPHCDGEQIVLHTEAPHELKVRLLQDAKALLFPSKMGEPFGLVAVEANSCGTPVVALRDGAIPEVVLEEVNGYVCNSMEEMAAMVGQVDKIKPENCRKIVEQNFSRNIMSQRYLDFYKNVLAGKEW